MNHPSWLLQTEIWLAAKLMPFSIMFRSFSEILNVAEASSCPRFAGISSEIIATATMNSTSHPWLMRKRRCLRQGLLGYRYLRKAGFHPSLHFAIEPESINRQNINAHCWVMLDGKPVINDTMADLSTIYILQPPNSSQKS